MTRWRAIVLAAVIGGPAVATAADTPPPDLPQARQEADRLDKMPPIEPHGGIHIDRSGRTEKGGGSYYAHRFANRKMADGRRMNPNSDVAASKTLPLGSVAKVTNTDNGKSATVKIEDRGPFVDGRVVDLAPKVADQLDIKKAGVVPVEVKPITVPEPHGGVKLGSGAAEVSPREVRQATETTENLTSKDLGETRSGGSKARQTTER